MNRRGMLGFLGLGSLAGPTIASDMVGQAPLVTQGSSGYYDNHHIATKSEHPGDYIKRMQEELSYLNVDSVKWIAERAASDMRDYMMGYASVNYQSIDPDIRNMKSITEVAKMRIYYERRAKRQLESQKESLTNRIAEYMGLVK